jgi:hypothetical protein
MKADSYFVGILVFLLLTAGCATSRLPDEMRSEIPASATTVQLHSDLPPDELYQGAYRTLRQKGFRFSETNEDMHNISTEGMRTGNSQTNLRIDLFVEPAERGSMLTATAEYELTPENWRPVAHKDSGTKYTVGFEELALLMRELPHEELICVVDQDRADRAFGIN